MKASSSSKTRRHPRWLRVLLAVLAVVLIVVLVFVVVLSVLLYTGNKTVQTAPANAFYQAPSSFDTTPGSVIREEPITQGVPSNSTAMRILYTTTAFDTGEPTVSSASLFVPNTPASGAGRPIIAWAHPTTGITTACAPSLADDGGASTIPGLDSFLQQGYAVVATDYPGLGTQGPHPFLVGSSEARAILDGVRATLNTPEAKAGNRFIVWGHSQGGQAALWTGQMAKSYSPELDLLGVAAAAPASELVPLYDADIDTLAASILGPMVFYSWSEVYPDTSMESIVTPIAMPIALKVAATCINSEKDLESIVLDAVLMTKVMVRANPTTVEPWKTLMRQNSAGGSPIGVPILITQGTDDTVVHPEVTQNFVQKLCSNGETVYFQLIKGVGHDVAGTVSAPAVALWAQDRFDGIRAPGNCGAQ